MIRFAFTAALLLAAQSAFAGTYDVAMPPKEGEKYKSADFRLWVPDGVKTVRAVIVRQHGCGRKGIDHADDLQWQALAAKYDAALLGTHYQTHKECKEWFDPSQGSNRAFLDALKHFAKESGHPELTDAPWALWGHSGGALWACHMANRYANRVVAVWARSQAVTEYDEATLSVPIVFNYGENEKTGQFAGVHKNSQSAFLAYRPKGAVWAVAVDPKSGHDCRNSRALAVRFFDKMLAIRLPKTGIKLNAVAKSAWAGDPEGLAIMDQRIRRGDADPMCWLIDEEFAKAWQEYCKTGDVKDTTAPPTPTGVKAASGDNGVSLEWKAVADVESGVKQFQVFKNGKLLATGGGEKTKTNQMGFFQIWNYGDEPEPKLPKFAHTDATGKPGDTYEVVTVNHADLASKKSEAANAK